MQEGQIHFVDSVSLNLFDWKTISLLCAYYHFVYRNVFIEHIYKTLFSCCYGKKKELLSTSVTHPATLFCVLMPRY